MSAAVFSIRASIACFARPTRALTPAGTASRTASSCCARVRSPGTAISTASRRGGVEQSTEADERRRWCLGIARTSDLFECLPGGRRRRQLERDEQSDRRRRRNVDAARAIDAVLAHEGEAARVHVLDGDDVEPVRIAAPPRLARRLAKRRANASAALAIVERHEGEALRRPDRQRREG